MEKELDLVTASGAAKILGWDRRQVNMYIMRGRFPAPHKTLNEGLEATQQRVWLRQDIEDFKAAREGKKRKEAPGDDGS